MASPALPVREEKSFGIEVDPTLREFIVSWLSRAFSRTGETLRDGTEKWAHRETGADKSEDGEECWGWLSPPDDHGHSSLVIVGKPRLLHRAEDDLLEELDRRMDGGGLSPEEDEALYHTIQGLRTRMGRGRLSL